MIRVNGVASNVAPVTDRGFAYGDGVFRTLRTTDGRPQHWLRHYAKLASDCARLEIACPDRDLLLAEVVSTAAALPECAVKVIITRGGGERGYRIPPQANPTRVVIASPLPQYPVEYFVRGVALFPCRLILSAQPALAGVKHLNRLENVMARAEWDDPRYAEGLLQDDRGNAIGGTMSNLFIVEGNTLYTPDLSRCGVAGVTRERVMEAARRQGMKCISQALEVDRVSAADEVFMVNSLIGAWPVCAIGTVAIRTGDVTVRVQEWLDGPEADD